MIRRLGFVIATFGLMFSLATPAWAEWPLWEDHDWLGLGWTNKYKAVGGCPGGASHPCNPFLAVPLHSSLGQTGPRRMLLWPPTLKSPLYNNTPRLVVVPPEERRQHGSNCSTGWQTNVPWPLDCFCGHQDCQCRK
jgi:hypothetical protein